MKINIVRSVRIFQAVLLLCIPVLLAAQEPGVEIMQKCKKNLEILNEATKKFLQAEKHSMPAWDSLENIRNMLLTSKYLPEVPKGPTSDCRYFLVFANDQNFDWYCDLHGTLDGDKTISFRYQEYKFFGKVKERYLTEPKYKSHYNHMLRRVDYSPTLLESVKYHYKKNPKITLAIVLLGIAAVYFVYRNVFGP